MAAVSLSPAPKKLGTMSSKRVPLGDVPNAANSPYRSVTAAVAKRTRWQTEAQEDLLYDLQPQAKRQALENGHCSQRSPPKKHVPQSAESRIFNRRPMNTQPNAFERRLLAAKEGKSVPKVERQEKASQMQLDDVRQWQKHYKKLFPSFVFYFESLPEDVRANCSKYVKSLGASEEKFFSKEVTHVVTTRSIPTESDPKNETDPATTSSTSPTSQSANQPRTINPSCLERHSEHQGQTLHPRNKFAFEAPTARRPPVHISRDVEPRKGGGNADILLRAKEMGMKVWSLDKLQRAIRAMFEIPNDSQMQTGNVTRAKSATVAIKGDRDADLSRMLKQEKLNGPSDRDAATALSEMIPFNIKGHHIYVRDMDERTKPILVRDYPKPAPDEYSEWPQFHSVGLGKCPFVPDADPPTRQEVEKAKIRQEEMRAKTRLDARIAPQTRAAAIRSKAQADSMAEVLQKRPLEVTRNGGNAAVLNQTIVPNKDICPPPTNRADTKSPVKVARQQVPNAGTKLFGGEPAASGMQPSNITSAIRSQMISSTAAAPGAKAGTSKEVYGLKRKVLEKNSAPALSHIHTRNCSIETAGPGRAERTISLVRQTRGQTREPLIHIDEETTQSEEDEDVWLAEDARSKKQTSQKVLEKKNVRPGYCENCREKYDDFDEHIIGRKHRKFALTQDHWKDLDRLLAHLGRRLKEPDSDGF